MKPWILMNAEERRAVSKYNEICNVLATGVATSEQVEEGRSVAKYLASNKIMPPNVVTSYEEIVRAAGFLDSLDRLTEQVENLLARLRAEVAEKAETIL